MESIVLKIRGELKSKTDETTRKSFQRFFKEEARFYGVKTALVGSIAKKAWNEIKSLDKKEIFAICEELYGSDYTEEAFVASFILPEFSDRFELKDLKLFKKWIDKYINNWAKCDGFCNHTIGIFVDKYPECIKEIKVWTKSENRWLKRAAAVSLIVPAKNGRFLNDILEIADALLTDKDDMVQKGYGWLLKEASRFHQKEIFDYVIKNKKVMPRTALRYSIELMPQDLRSEAMNKTVH
jgi:3-methyladenine DNA glycosylase AlkD